MARAPRFRYHEKFDPTYNPYGTELTERQQRIIRGMDIYSVSRNELTVLMRKLEKMGDEETLFLVYEMYDELLNTTEDCKYTIEEAKAVIQSLVPWEIKW